MALSDARAEPPRGCGLRDAARGTISRQPDFDEWIRSDIEYIQNWSLGRDLKILARTLPAVINSTGVY